MKAGGDGFKDFVLDQLSGLRGVACRAMFGGYGLYRGRRFFGIIHGGRLYFKARPETLARFLDQGMAPFRPNERLTLKRYYEVPPDVLEDADLLTEWAKTACGPRPTPGHRR